MKDLQQYITNFQNAITVNNETANNYSNVKSSIVSKNQLIVRDYENNIRILNEGKINIAQQPNESEDEYLRRLDDMADEEYDDTELVEKAYLANINEFKQNMKSILSTEWKVENILNSLQKEEVFGLNKTFPSFQKDFLETFGRNNTNVSIEEYIELIKLPAYADCPRNCCIRRTECS
jgi:hypothetical protein